MHMHMVLGEQAKDIIIKQDECTGNRSLSWT
jgi:hypothetical protein